jgi:hypothetical protein
MGAESQSQHLKATDSASMAGRTARDSNSRVGSRGHMKRTESEILNDPNIWNLSESGSDEDGLDLPPTDGATENGADEDMDEYEAKKTGAGGLS